MEISDYINIPKKLAYLEGKVNGLVVVVDLLTSMLERLDKNINEIKKQVIPLSRTIKQKSDDVLWEEEQRGQLSESTNLYKI